MRIARFFIAYGVVSVLGVLVSLFLAQNTQAERLTFFGQDVSTNLAWIMLGATSVGFLFALLLLLPGRIAAMLHIWTLRREARDLDEELAWQSEQHDELLAHHERLLTGHEWLLSAHRRTRGELDQAINEREALRARLAIVTTALADLQETRARQLITAPAAARKVEEIPAPAARRTQVEVNLEARVPVAVGARETVDPQEEVETPTLTMRSRALPASPSEAREVIEQTHVAVSEAETVNEELAPVHVSASFGERFGERFANGRQWLITRLVAAREATISLSRRLYSEGAYRVEQGIAGARRLGSTAWAFVQARAGELGLRPTQGRKRVPSMSHPK
jgi:uncharacterized integral membrane protein